MAKEELMDAVIKAYQDKLRQNPNSLVFVQLADAYRKKGSLDEALKVVDEGLAKNPNLLSALLMAGRLHSAKKDHGKAVEMLKRVVQREPSNLSAHSLLSQSYLAVGRVQEAVGELQRILALNPEDQSAQQELKSALEKMRREAPAARAAGAAAAPAAPPVAPAAAAPAAAPAAEAPGARPPAPAPAPVAEMPAFAAADELAMRGMYDEAIEAYQRILDAEPDNFMARSKLREVYRMRDAIEAPSTAPVPAPSASEAPRETQADKISDDEILYLLGLMEATADTPSPAPPLPSAPADASSARLDEPLLGELEKIAPAPRVEFRAAAPAPAAEEPAAEEPAAEEPAAEEPAAKAAAAEEPAAKAAAAKEPAAAAPEQKPAAPAKPAGTQGEEPAPGKEAAKASKGASGKAASGPPAIDEDRVREVLGRLAGTEGMRQVFLVAGERLVATGEAPGTEQAERATTLVRMLSDITRRASDSMKQGEVRQVLVFGTEGMVMVSPAVPGILAAVAGAGVKVGLLRLALNDCLRRLGEVS